jgi:hypothetical protein
LVGDTGYPNYLTVGADGSVAGSFPGGVDMRAASVPGIVPGRSVQWHQGSVGGPVVAAIGGGGSGGGRPGTLGLEVLTAAGAIGALLSLNADTSPTFGLQPGINIYSAGTSRNLLNGQTSDFLQGACLNGYQQPWANTVNVNFPLPWSNIAGVFSQSGFNPSGIGASMGYWISIDGIGAITSTQSWVWNATAQHLTLPSLVALSPVGQRAAGTYTFRHNFTGQFNADAADLVSGFFVTW